MAHDLEANKKKPIGRLKMGRAGVPAGSVFVGHDSPQECGLVGTECSCCDNARMSYYKVLI